jgi:hypothetical protein
MPRDQWRDDADDELDDFETDDFEPGEDWTDDPDDESATLPCPRCGRDVYDDAPYCPHCDADLAEAAARNPPRKPWWIILGTLASLLIFLSWIFLL